MPDPSDLGDLFLARIGSSYMLRMLAVLSELFDGEVMLGIVFLAVSQAATGHLSLHRELNDFGGDGIVPDELRRPVAVLAIAHSLNIPRETARRHVARLIERGYCAPAPGRRVVIPGDVYRRPEIRAAIEANRRNLQVVFAAARRVDLLGEAPACPEGA